MFADLRITIYIRFAAKFLTHVPKHTAVALKYLGPVVEKRRQDMELYGDNWLDKPVRGLRLSHFKCQKL